VASKQRAASKHPQFKRIGDNSGKKPLKSIVAEARRRATTHYQQHPELRGERSVLARPFLAPTQADNARRRA
jgi:hypothetical protein